MIDAIRLNGSATIYRLHDVGYAISLDVAADLFSDATRKRVRPARGEARAIQIRNPPLYLALGQHDVAIGGAPHVASLSAHLFDFGVCSMQVRLETPPDASWTAYTDFGSEVESSGELSALLARETHAFVEKIRPAVERPTWAPLSEDYKVFRVDRIDGVEAGTPIAELFTNDRLVPLLLGERRALAPSAQRELLPYRFSYYHDDLVVLSWDNALVVEPRANDRDVEYVLEFANAQLLELRLFDLQLDAELPALYDRVEAARRAMRLSGRFRAVLAWLQAYLADLTETVERVENSLKVTNDVYLARVYSAALDLFREGAWRRGVERKLGILRETYGMLHSEAQAARGELLEVAIVVLIVAELVIGLFGVSR